MRLSIGLNLFIVVFLMGIGACSSSGVFSNGADVFGDDLPSANATLLGPAEGNDLLNLVFGLSRSQDALAERVREISTPGSAQYQAFLDVQTIAQEFGAPDSVKSQVLNYFAQWGISLHVDITGAFATGTATVTQINALFSTQLMQYEIPNVGQFIALDPDFPPSLPTELNGLVTEVLGLNTEPGTWRSVPPNPVPPPVRPSNQVDTPGSPHSSGTREGCADALAKKGFTPNQLLTAFGVSPLHNAGYQGQGIHMALVELSAFDQKSIETFNTCFELQLSYTPRVVELGRKVPPINSGEPFLDINVLAMVAPKLSGLHVFQIDAKSFADWVTLFSAPLDPIHTLGHPVDIISSSIANCELKWTPHFVKLMEHVLLTAAAVHVHVFNSAGDSGSSACYHHDHTTTAMSASYPSTSQYVTSVGGTNLLLNMDNSIAGEGVWNDLDFPPPFNEGTGGGGGGPSTYISRPFWQIGTSQSTTMRTTPDVAFFADPAPGYVVYNSLKGWFDNGGTSAATPFLAGSTALLLQIARAQGQTLDLSPIWIYQLATDPNTYDTIFQDVTLVNNDVFGVGCCSAAPGYDQASGWGSMNLSAVATALFGF